MVDHQDVPQGTPDKTGAAERHAADGVLLAFTALPPQAQRHLLPLMWDHVWGDDPGRAAPPTAQEQQKRDEAFAQAAMHDIADAQGLPAGQAPTRTQYEAHAHNLGLPSYSTIARIHGGWANAQRAYEGMDLPRRVRGGGGARIGVSQNTERTALLRHLNRWLQHEAQNAAPVPVVDLTTKHYVTWQQAQEQNAARTSSLQATPTWKYLSRELPTVPFDELKRLATDPDVTDRDLTAIGRRYAEQRLRDKPNPLQLVGTATAADLIGITHAALTQRIQHDPISYLTSVANLGGVRPAYHAQDARDRGAGRTPPTRTVNALRARILGSRDLATVLGLDQKTVSRGLRTRGPSVPAPDGSYGDTHYWLSETVDKWVSQRRGRT